LDGEGAADLLGTSLQVGQPASSRGPGCVELSSIFAPYRSKKPAGISNDIVPGPYRFELNPLGMYLDDSQKQRLARYKPRHRSREK